MANQLVDDINAGKGALGKFAKDEQFAKKLDNTVTRLSTIMDRLDSGEGTAGKLLRDPALFNNADQMLVETRKLVLAIRENVTQLVFIDEADSKIWGERLTKARPLLDLAIPAVGRIDLTGAPLDWIGTGWLVAENVIVSNRHVARELGRIFG